MISDGSTVEKEEKGKAPLKGREIGEAARGAERRR